MQIFEIAKRFEIKNPDLAGHTAQHRVRLLSTNFPFSDVPTGFLALCRPPALRFVFLLPEVAAAGYGDDHQLGRVGLLPLSAGDIHLPRFAAGTVF